MRSTTRRVVAALLALLALHPLLADAQVTVTRWKYSAGSLVQPSSSDYIYTTADEACDAAFAATTVAAGRFKVLIWRPSEHSGGCYIRTNCVYASCSWNSTNDVTEVTASITSAQVADPACGAKAGQSVTKNLTIGWSRTAGELEGSAWDSAVAVGAGNVGTSVCDGQCTLTVGAPTAVWQAQTPSAQGLYRLSADYSMSYSGAACTSKTPNIDPTQPPAQCDGYVGQLNGKTVCVQPKGATADPPTTMPKPPQKGNPGANTDANAPQSTREPGTGTGGNDGGPLTTGYGNIRGGTGDATNGSGGTGNNPASEFPEPYPTCGYPGGPPCKIDETGTPTGSGAYDAAKGTIDQTKQQATDLIGAASGTSGKNTGWTFTFSLPTGCAPLTAWDNISINVCQWQPQIHDLMSMVWAAATFFACVGMVRKAIGGA